MTSCIGLYMMEYKIAISSKVAHLVRTVHIVQARCAIAAAARGQANRPMYNLKT